MVKRDALLTDKVMLTVPSEWLKTIDALLGPMQTRQDFIRMAVQEKLEQLPKKVK